MAAEATRSAPGPSANPPVRVLQPNHVLDLGGGRLEQVTIRDGHHPVLGTGSHAIALARAELVFLEAMPLVEDGLKLALLDVQVADGKSFPLASLVVTRNIPCLFLSGSEPRSVPSDLASIPFLRKPVPPGQLIAAVQHYLR